MKRLLAFLLLTASTAFADTGYGHTIRVTEQDGSPACTIGQLKVTNGTLTCNGQSASVQTGSGGGGGGSSSLQVTKSGVEITSPTASMRFYGGDFGLTAINTTAQIILNPATTNYIWNNGSAQTATFNASSGTATSFNSVDSTFTNITADKITFKNQGNTRVLFMNGSNFGTSSTYTWNGTTMTATVVSGSTVAINSAPAGVCLQTGDGGVIRNTGEACQTSTSTNFVQNTLSPTTSTQKFSIQQGTFTSTAVTPNLTWSAKNSVMKYQDGTVMLSLPDAQTMYMGYGSATTPTGGGTFNTAYGASAMAGVNTGSFNTAVGNASLAGALTGDQNNCIGYASCNAITSGAYNNAMGGSALLNTTSGSSNVGVGLTACRDCNGDNNTAVGTQASEFLSTGSGNTEIGYQAGVGTTTITNSNVAGSNNTRIGYQSGQSVSSSTVISKSIAIGYRAWNDTSQQAQIGGRFGSGDEVILRVASMTVEGTLATVNSKNVCLQDGTNCPSATGSGIVSPGTFTWVNTGFGITLGTATFGSATSTSLGNNSWTTFNSSGTSQALTVNINGQPSGGVQNAVGGVTINALGPGGPPIDMLVIRSSYTSSQGGSCMLCLNQENPLRNDPIIWIHRVNNDSSPEMRWDGPSVNMEIVNTSTDNAHGLGKWEPFAVANQGVDLQINNRAYDNSTFETLAYWHPLHLSAPNDSSMPGLYLRAQNVAEDGGVITSSGTSGIAFYTQNSRIRGLTGPMNPSASWWDALPATTGSAGNLLFHGGNVSNGALTVRQWAWSGNDYTYSATTGVSVSTITVGSTLNIPNGTDPVVDATGETAFDTTSGQLITYDGQFAQVVGASTQSVTVTISSGSGWNGLSIPVWRTPVSESVNINQIRAETLASGTTVLFQLDERAFGSINSAGSSLFSVAYSTANNTGVTTLSLSDSSIAAGSSLVLTTPSAGASAGSPTMLTFTIYYRRNRQ